MTTHGLSELFRTHPDRLSTASPAEKMKATEKFQARAQPPLARNFGSLTSSAGRGRCLLCTVRPRAAEGVRHVVRLALLPGQDRRPELLGHLLRQVREHVRGGTRGRGTDGGRPAAGRGRRVCRCVRGGPHAPRLSLRSPVADPSPPRSFCARRCTASRRGGHTLAPLAGAGSASLSRTSRA